MSMLSTNTEGATGWNAQWQFQILMFRITNGCCLFGPTPSTLGLPKGTPPPRLKAWRRWQWASLSSKRMNGSVRMSTCLLLPSGWRMVRAGSKSAVLAAFEEKAEPYKLQATLRVKLFRLLAHQKPEPSFLSNGTTCCGSGLVA